MNNPTSGLKVASQSPRVQPPGEFAVNLRFFGEVAHSANFDRCVVCTTHRIGRPVSKRPGGVKGEPDAMARLRLQQEGASEAASG